MVHLPLFFRVTSLALGQSQDCPSASEVIPKDNDMKLTSTKTQQSVNFMDIFLDILVLCFALVSVNIVIMCMYI